MADDLQSNLQNYVLQLQQVEAALTIDPDNEELQKLKIDLEEVLTLTKDLIKQQLVEKKSTGGSDKAAAPVVSESGIINSIPRQEFKVGDMCMAMSSDDGVYYEAIIEDMNEEQDNVSCRLQHNGVLEVTAVSFLKPIKKPNVKKKPDQDLKHRKQSQSQREYQKKKKLKKQQRYKQMEEERETEKNKWLAFTTKKKGAGIVGKKSIFASPDSVTGRVGIGTCGVSGLPMTEFSHAEKRKKGT